MIGQSLLSPALALADGVVDAVDIWVNGRQVQLGALNGNAWVYVYADAMGAPNDADSSISPVMAATSVSSRSWLGTGVATGRAVVPNNVIPLHLAPASFAFGGAVADAACGVGTAFQISGPWQGSLVPSVGLMAVDPAPGLATAKAGLRAFLRLENGKEIEFWRAEVAVESDPNTGGPKLVVTDDHQLIGPHLFQAYELPDGRAGFATGGAGFDVDVPIPDLSPYTGQNVGINLECTTSAAAQAAWPEEQPRTTTGEEVAALLQELPTSMANEVGGWLKVAAEQLISAETGQLAVGLGALEHAWMGSLKFDRPDLTAAIGGLRRTLVGLVVDWVELPHVSLFDDETLDRLRNLRFRVNGASRLEQADLELTLTVNGSEPSASKFSFDPPGAQLEQTGVVRWSFDEADRERVIWSQTSETLGLQAGSNHIVVTLRGAKDEMLGSVDAFVLLEE